MPSDSERDEGRSFKVEDRRRFSSDTGEPRETAEKGDPGEAQGEEPVRPTEGSRPTSKEPLAEINFSMFVISLSTQALMHLGEVSSPLSGEVEKDVGVAKQMIDILGMLQEKTRGNLDEDEKKLIEDILFDLRMKYVDAVRKK